MRVILDTKYNRTSLPIPEADGKFQGLLPQFLFTVALLKLQGIAFQFVRRVFLQQSKRFSNFANTIGHGAPPENSFS